MSYPSSPNYVDWLRGWKEWARTRKRGRMAQFIIEKLEEGKQAKWIAITSGLFELTEWHLIAKEWFGEKPRNSEEVDAPCMLRKGLPRAFPGLEEVKERSRKEGTQYRSRVFQAPSTLLQEVLLHVSNNGPHSVYTQQHQDSPNDHSYLHTTAYHYSNDSGYTIPNYPMIQVKSEFSPQVATGGSTAPLLTQLDHHATADYTRIITNGGERYLQQAQTFRSRELDRFAHEIVTGGGGGGMVGNGDNSMETATVPYPPSSTGLVNGWPYTPSTEPTVTALLPNSPPVYVDDLSQGGGGGAASYSISSPASGAHTYHHSPVSTHSPRISPEPSHLSTSSYPPSVSDLQQHHLHQQPPLSAGLVGGAGGGGGKPHHGVVNGAIDLSPANVQSPNIVPDEVSDIMEVKVLPNSSPTEGGGHMALVFYQPLPIGPKVVYFISTSNHGYYQMEQALDENALTLSCPIPKYPIAEEVELRVFCDQQPIASTSFTFYQHLSSSSPEMLLQMLNSQLHSQFQIGGQGAMGGATGGGAGSQTTYPGYIPTSMYQLLLGACRLGCEPLVFCLLCSPIMDKISGDQLKEAYECASANGHESLAEHLMEIHLLHDMSAPQLLSRGEGQTSPSHVPAYYDAIDQLDQGGDTPQERAETVLKHVLEAIEKGKEKTDKEKEEEKEEEEVEEERVIDDTTPTVEALASLSITEPDDEPISDLTPVETGLKRKLSSSSKLVRQPNSISDQGNHERDLPSSSSSDNLKPFSPTRRESADEVADLPQYNFRKLPINQVSDADSAIGLSFDEDGILQGDSCRRSSLLTDLQGGATAEGGQFGVKVTIPPQSGMEVVNCLDWETGVLVASDYPPNQEKKLFYKGDQIVQIGDHVIRNPDPKSFNDLFHSEVSSGSVIYVLPHPSTADRSTGPTDVPQKLLLRSFSDQSLFSSSRINQVLNCKPSSQERRVVIPYSSSGFGFKLVGGKTVGIFMNDIRPELSSQVSQGDQILEINGRGTSDLSLYDVNQLLQSTETDLQLTVLENRAKFLTVRDQIELDSFYMRSLIDHTPTNNREMPLKKGSLLRVVNTFHSPYYWLAWSVDERNGVETQLKKIPTPQSAQKQYGSPVYERVTRIDGVTNRPVCIIGSSSDSLVSSMCSSTGNNFKMCLNMEDVLLTRAQDSVHGVMSVKDVKTVQLMSVLHPIVLQVTSPGKTTLKEHMSFAKLNIDASLVTGDVDLTKQALDQVNKIQSLPIWKPLGPLVN